MIRAAHVVLAGNRFLSAQAEKWTAPARVHVAPTCVEPARYRLASHINENAVQLAWIGSGSTLRGMERARPLLECVGQQVPGLQLKVICDRALILHNIRVLPCAWSETTEAEALATADIGISWIPDDLWSRGKCGLKVLQYMAAGLPVIANPVGVHVEMVRPGETGFLVETPDEWIEAVRRLAASPCLRREMGQAGRRLVENHYGTAAGAARLLERLNPLQQRRRTA
jgi:glycosyltransferase involved in cell wall biosynthesis